MKKLAVLLFCLAAAACATVETDLERRTAFVNEYPWAVHAKQVLAGEVIPGMMKGEVIASWGRPMDGVQTVTANGIWEQWEYPHHFVYFDGSFVEAVQSRY